MGNNLTNGVVVIGLGRFGTSLALELMHEGEEVLGIDASEATVNSLTNRLTHVVQADATNEDSMRQLGMTDFNRAVIAVATELESSVLSASVAVGLGVREVWAKATTASHARILSKIGVHHVVRPEHDMGRRVAHLVRGRMQDYIEFDEDYAFVKTTAPGIVKGVPLGESLIRKEHGVTIVGYKPAGGEFTYATEKTVVEPGDLIIVSGREENVEAFCELR